MEKTTQEMMNDLHSKMQKSWDSKPQHPFKIGDDVEWFDGPGSIIKYYGTIVKLNKKTALIRDDDAFEQLIKIKDLNWT